MKCRRGSRFGRRLERLTRVIEKLYSGIRTVLQNSRNAQETRSKVAIRPGGMPPGEFAKFVKAETEKYGKIVKTIGMQKN